MRKLAIIFLLIIGSLSIWYAWLFWQNNRQIAMADRTTLSASLDQAASWLETNRSKVIRNNNPMLWWMIKESSIATGDPRLNSIYSEYKARYIDTKPANVWSPLFISNSQARVPPVELLSNLPAYNLLFIYGINCDRYLGRESAVQRQLEPSLCAMHFLHPRCVTHQLMGVRLMQRNNCENTDTVKNLATTLQDIIVTELTWDPRVGDAYLQRVAMLVETGALKRIKPIWIRRILEAQYSDGGWGDLDPIIHMPGGQAFGFTSTLPTVKPLHSNFHATAQGIWLMSLLLNQH